MGDALSGMDFKLYGTPETAQQILRMMSLTDGVSNIVQSAPPQLKELGNRLLDRVIPPTNGSHGNGDGHGALPIDMNAMQGLLVEGQTILRALLTADERKALTVHASLEQALTRANDPQRATLLKLLGLVALMPAIAEQSAASVIDQ
jgi:hypothetical protein